jgi:hypothetical protein
MRTSDVLEYFGARSDDPESTTAAIKAIANALGIKAPSVYGWGDTVPPLRQLQLERITDGVLKPDPALLPDEVAAPSLQQASESYGDGQLR